MRMRKSCADFIPQHRDLERLSIAYTNGFFALPPTHDSLSMHIKHASFQSTVWTRCLQLKQKILRVAFGLVLADRMISHVLSFAHAWLMTLA